MQLISSLHAIENYGSTWSRFFVRSEARARIVTGTDPSSFQSSSVGPRRMSSENSIEIQPEHIPSGAPRTGRLLVWIFLISGMLILVGGGAAAFGYVRHQQALIEEISDMGGTSRLRPMTFESIPERLQPGLLMEFVAVSLDGCEVEDEWLKKLEGEDQLRWLDFDGTSISDRGLASITEMRRLHVLGLEDTRVTDEGIPYLSGMKELLLLDLTRTDVSDRSLPIISELESLQALGLDGTSVTNDGMSNLVVLTNLLVLDLEDTQVGDEAIDDLGQMIHLHEIYIAGAQFSPDGSERLKEMLPSTRIFVDKVDRTRRAGAVLMR